MNNPGLFHQYMERARLLGSLPVRQPRMGFSEVSQMRIGLESVKQVTGGRIGTITLDALTRQRMFAAAKNALRAGTPLNGFPIVTHGVEATRAMLDGLQATDFPVQVRHGSPLPKEVFEAAAGAGIDAIEGGPISYCLPYGRVPLSTCINAWGDAAQFWAEEGQFRSATFHLESFAGCMMGQLNPPELLVALSILEGLFFVERGIESLSLSHAQGTNRAQDIGAILALRRLIGEYLPARVTSHIVLYTWMGVFPESKSGARRLIEDSGVLAAIAGVERIIVKTAVEAFQIPTVEDNVQALKWVGLSAYKAQGLQPDTNALEHEHAVYVQAKSIIDAVLNLSFKLDQAILLAFQKGVLDVPFCFHPDNKNEARAFLDTDTGVIGWERTGHIPIDKCNVLKKSKTLLTAELLLRNLTFNKRKYDEA